MAHNKNNRKLLSQLSRINKSTVLLKELFNSSLDAGNLRLCNTINIKIERNNQKKFFLNKKIEEVNKLSSWEQFLLR